MIREGLLRGAIRKEIKNQVQKELERVKKEGTEVVYNINEYDLQQQIGYALHRLGPNNEIFNTLSSTITQKINDAQLRKPE